MATSTEVLGTYLNDHLGGSNAGVLLARRLRERMGDSLEGEVLAGILDEIEQDRDELRDMIGRLGVDGHPMKELSGWVAGKLHRLGVTEIVTGDEDLGRLLECESLAIGIDGKLALWNALIAVAQAYPVIDRARLERLAERARDQRERIESIRCAAAVRAFGVSS